MPAPGGAVGFDPPVREAGDPVAAARQSLLPADPGDRPESRFLSPVEAIQPNRPGATPVAIQPAGMDTARGAAWQIARAVRAGSQRSFDLALDPAELGKVRITLTPGDSGMTVTIQADRTETLELLRRHADMLGQDFREMGYGSTSFTFEHGSRSPRNGGGDAVTKGAPVAGIPEAPTVPEANRTPSAATLPGRVDIRL